jgi:transcriptional regulator with XRE-family HTH domain
MDSAALVQLALKTSSCDQKTLAKRLGVSETQITKWKRGESMSYEQQQKIRKITKIGDKLDPEFVLASGSVEAAKKWEKLVRFLAKNAYSNAENESGFETDPFADGDLEGLPWQTWRTLQSMGVEWPRSFPLNWKN